MPKILKYSIPLIALTLLWGCEFVVEANSPEQNSNSHQFLQLISNKDEIWPPGFAISNVGWLPHSSVECREKKIPREKCLNFTVLGQDKEEALENRARLIKIVQAIPENEKSKFSGSLLTITSFVPINKCSKPVTPYEFDRCYERISVLSVDV